MFEIETIISKKARIGIAAKGKNVAVCIDGSQTILNVVDAIEIADAMRNESGAGEGWNVETDDWGWIVVSFGDWSVRLESQKNIDDIIDALRSAVKEILKSINL